jgi:cysteine/glycine-rich protein
VCSKTAFPAETIQYEKKAYHVECFQCSECKKKMDGPAGAANYEGVLFCKHCFAKGGYSLKQKAVSWTPSADAGSAAPSKFGGGGLKCTTCEKTVYAAETVSYEKKPYHAECFKCHNCAKKMSPSGAAAFEDKLLCSKCFADGGYRQKQAASASKKTDGKPATSSAPSKFGGGGQKCYGCQTTVYAAEAIAYEKKLFHGDCFKCKNCAKKVSPSGAEAKRSGDEIDVFCKKCWGELGLNRASVALKKSADSTTESSSSEGAQDAGSYEASNEAPAEYAAAEETPEAAAAEE